MQQSSRQRREEGMEMLSSQQRTTTNNRQRRWWSCMAGREDHAGREKGSSWNFMHAVVRLHQWFRNGRRLQGPGDLQIDGSGQTSDRMGSSRVSHITATRWRRVNEDRRPGGRVRTSRQRSTERTTYVGYGDAGSSCKARREEWQKILHDGEAASKLGMGGHGHGHLVFMARSSLRCKAREEAWAAWTCGCWAGPREGKK